MLDNPTPFTNSLIVAAYEQRTPASKARHLAAREVFPSGIVHDSRHMTPHPLTIERAEGSWKWDADGNKYIDFYGGHGALLLGHAHPSLVEAVNRQIRLGTHPAACHDLELQWGQLVQRLIPSAERLRFTSSGTEANLMAIRLARAFTGRNKLVRLKNHFHGWQDHVAFGSIYPRRDHRKRHRRRPGRPQRRPGDPGDGRRHRGGDFGAHRRQFRADSARPRLRQDAPGGH
jgi:glutamate-1-semialdehyde 2,1-aminomutase